MRSSLFFSGSLLVLLFCWHCGSADHVAPPVPEFNAEEVVGAWVDLWNTYDLSGVDSLFLTDDRLTYLSSEREGLIRGIEAVREHHRGFGFVEGGTEQGNTLWLEDLHAQSFGAVTSVTGVWYFRTAAADSAQKGPVTFVYLHDGTRHRIAHVHFANY